MVAIPNSEIQNPQFNSGGEHGAEDTNPDRQTGFRWT